MVLANALAVESLEECEHVGQALARPGDSSKLTDPLRYGHFLSLAVMHQCLCHVRESLSIGYRRFH